MRPPHFLGGCCDMNRRHSQCALFMEQGNSGLALGHWRPYATVRDRSRPFDLKRYALTERMKFTYSMVAAHMKQQGHARGCEICTDGYSKRTPNFGVRSFGVRSESVRSPFGVRSESVWNNHRYKFHILARALVVSCELQPSNM